MISYHILVIFLERVYNRVYLSFRKTTLRYVPPWKKYMISEFLANFRSEKQLTLPTGVKGKWIGTGANERLHTYYNNGKSPQIIMQNLCFAFWFWNQFHPSFTDIKFTPGLPHQPIEFEDPNQSHSETQSIQVEDQPDQFHPSFTDLLLIFKITGLHQTPG